MSTQPKSIRSKVAEWRHDACSSPRDDPNYVCNHEHCVACRVHAKQLEALLDEWDAEMEADAENQFYDGLFSKIYIQQAILGTKAYQKEI